MLRNNILLKLFYSKASAFRKYKFCVEVFNYFWSKKLQRMKGGYFKADKKKPVWLHIHFLIIINLNEAFVWHLCPTFMLRDLFYFCRLMVSLAISLGLVAGRVRGSLFSITDNQTHFWAVLSKNCWGGEFPNPLLSNGTMDFHRTVCLENGPLA